MTDSEELEDWKFRIEKSIEVTQNMVTELIKDVRLAQTTFNVWQDNMNHPTVSRILALERKVSDLRDAAVKRHKEEALAEGPYIISRKLEDGSRLVTIKCCCGAKRLESYTAGFSGRGPHTSKCWNCNKVEGYSLA